MVGAILMYVATTWEPLKRAIAALQQPPPAAPARPVPPRNAAPLGVDDHGGNVPHQQREDNSEAAIANQPQPRCVVMLSLLMNHEFMMPLCFSGCL